MVLLTAVPRLDSGQTLPASFRLWQRDVLSRGKLPLIGVGGTRGKSTVVRLVDAIFTGAGLKTAIWTNVGVEVRGRHQRSELGGWSRALAGLADGSTDAALQELDWTTVYAVGLPVEAYPIIALTNLCGNSEACLVDGQTRHALRALPTILHAVVRDGVVVLNGDDWQLGDGVAHLAGTELVTGISAESPAIREARSNGQASLWTEGGAIVIGSGPEEPTEIVQFAEVPLTLGGDATFEVSNVLTAVGVALCCGLDIETIRVGVSGFEAGPSILPGSFNVHDVRGGRAVVDRLGPSWSLRPVLRAVNPGGRSSLVTVLGSLDTVTPEEALEFGRVLARYRGVVILHSTDREEILSAFRRGLAVSSIPPLMIRLPTERRALNRGIKALRSGTVLLVLTSAPGVANRALARSGLAPFGN